MKLSKAQQLVVDVMNEFEEPFIVNRHAHVTPQKTTTTYSVNGMYFRHQTFAALRDKKIIQYYGEVRYREQWILTDEYKTRKQ